MGITVFGFIELGEAIDDMQISDQKKRKALFDAAQYTIGKVKEASPVRRKILKNSWSYRYQRVDGNLAVRVYSKANHDIYNEYGSSTNKAHIGFFSNTIDRELDKISKIIVEGVVPK